MSDLASEFYLEAEELFNDAEESLLRLEESQEFDDEYVCLFRSFHSLKGAAGMLGFTILQKHMHVLENNLCSIKENGKMSTEQLTYFLKGIDFGKKAMLEGGEGIEFDLAFPRESVESEQSKEIPGESSETSNVVNLESKKPEIINDEMSIQTTVDAYQSVIDGFQGYMGDESKKVNKPTKNEKEETIFTVAIIDDEVEILEILNDYFSEQKVKVHIYGSFDEFSAKLEKINADAILTDFKMPDKDGLDILKFVRSKSPLLPVILLSGYLDKKIIIEALEDGISGVIEKPIDLKNVYSQVKQNALKYKTLKLLNRSIDLLIFNYKNYDEYLKKENKNDERQFLKSEIKNILQLKKQIYDLVG